MHPLTEPLQPVSSLDATLSVARSIGWGAVRILRSYYRGEPHPDGSERPLEIRHQPGGPVTAADLAVNHYVLSQLKAVFGTEAFGYLSEETDKVSPITQPLPYDWVWIIDPLDGTRDFIERTGDHAFHLALVHHGRPVLAVVACPERDTLYYATRGGGTFRETPAGLTQAVRVAQPHCLDELTLIVSPMHRGTRLNRLLERLPSRKTLAVGSIGGKIVAILERRADVYISLSGQSAPKDWDMAAPELILTEAGGLFTHADGRSLQYNTGDVSQWGCIIASPATCHWELCTEVQRLLAEIDRTS
ncbi:MAG: 3'(2'),5'-bisphosphate nucleotidase CysQ [Synechococcales cyanobacterium C42_A2020_086]|nr:3'(2'),5'-bisphosphate nucleotidase CysQ [Synechococcales cyanobacterium M58_A2018_015]MBF2072438.1 3'(2'),5'-bisphosphate nucleotidase CysQ [Synechococcales cyanobacterium C42_A2020_086]